MRLRSPGLPSTKLETANNTTAKPTNTVADIEFILNSCLEIREHFESLLKFGKGKIIVEFGLTKLFTLVAFCQSDFVESRNMFSSSAYASRFAHADDIARHTRRINNGSTTIILYRVYATSEDLIVKEPMKRFQTHGKYFGKGEWEICVFML